MQDIVLMQCGVVDFAMFQYICVAKTSSSDRLCVVLNFAQRLRVCYGNNKVLSQCQVPTRCILCLAVIER